MTMTNGKFQYKGGGQNCCPIFLSNVTGVFSLLCMRAGVHICIYTCVVCVVGVGCVCLERCVRVLSLVALSVSNAIAGPYFSYQVFNVCITVSVKVA